MKRVVLLLGVLMMVASCATVPTPATEKAPSPLPGRGTTSAPTTGTSSGAARPAAPSPMPQGPGSARGSGASAQSRTVIDSLPSREALEVLKSIPEPLSPGERVPAPSRSALAPDSTAESAADSSAVAGDSAAADSSGADSRAPDAAQVPIPSPTVPLGDRPGSLTRPADTLATSAAGGAGGSPSTPAGSGGGASPAGPQAGPPPTGAAPSRSAAPDSCWRIQVAAKPEAARAQALREAAQSQLLVPMVIEVEKGLHKVRTRDCLSAAAAELLRHRALAAGFAGTFRFRGGPR